MLADNHSLGRIVKGYVVLAGLRNLDIRSSEFELDTHLRCVDRVNIAWIKG